MSIKLPHQFPILHEKNQTPVFDATDDPRGPQHLSTPQRCQLRGESSAVATQV